MVMIQGKGVQHDFFGNGSAIHPYLFRIGQIEPRWRWREGSIHEKPERVDRQEKPKEKEKGMED